MTHINDSIIGLLIAAIVVALAARRLKLPYTVGLVLAGLLLSLTHMSSGIGLTHDLIFQLLLPPLLFEAALSIHWRDLKRDFVPVLVLSVVGVLIAAATVAAGMVALLKWPVAPAAVFGVLIAATDPVSVIALFRDIGVRGRLLFLVESESLLNDGVAAVLFAIVLSWTTAHGAVTAAGVSVSFLLISMGGLAIGGLFGMLAIGISGRTSDHVLELALTTVAAFGSFYLAEHLHVSGVLATVAAGLVMGNLGVMAGDDRSALSERGQEAVETVWEYAAFLANSLVFLLIGLAVAGVAFVRLGPPTLAAIVGLVLLGRALTVYPLCALFHRRRWAVPLREQHVLWWGGLRGALALALALALPDEMEGRADILVATFCVVVFSVVVQGLTVAPLLRVLRIERG